MLGIINRLTFVKQLMSSRSIPVSFNRLYHQLTTKDLDVPVKHLGINCTIIEKGSALLKPAPLVLLSQICGFKVKGILKKRCKDCYFVVRGERSYVICKTHPRHKQMSMKQQEKKSWILTHATQSKVRPW